jgi:hypothetical protein
MLGAQLARQPPAHVLRQHHRVAGGGKAVGDAFQNGGEVADRNTFRQEDLQHALNARNGDQRRHDILDQLALFFRQLLEQFLHLSVGKR